MALRSSLAKYMLRDCIRRIHATKINHVLSQNKQVSKCFVNFSSSSLRTAKSNSYLRPLALACAGGTVFTSIYAYLSLKNELTPIVNAAEVDPPRRQFNFIADVVEKAAPAVVYIEIKGRHPFHGSYATMSNGSGFIVRDDGLILTNAHVVGNKTSVYVKLHDGREFNGAVTAVDPVSDLATVKINADGLPTLKLGKSSSLRPGEWVIAMGSPLALSNTVTSGIVSSVNRGSKELGIHNKDMEYIQTDAVINDGEAIGINTMKVTTGISFAIPSDYASHFLVKADDLMKRGSFPPLSVEKRSRGWFGMGKGDKRRRYIGITMLTLTPSIQLELRERMTDFPDVQQGVFVHKVIIGSPAHSGGIQPGDVITKINGDAVKSSSDIYSAVESSDVIRVVVMRGRRQILLTIQTEEVE